MRAKQGSIERQPALEQQDGLLEKVLLSNSLCELLDEIKSEESAKLAYRNVDWRASNFEFDHKRVCLVDEIDAGKDEL